MLSYTYNIYVYTCYPFCIDVKIYISFKGAIAKTLTCSELHKRSEKIAALLQERGRIEPGDHVGKF